MDKANKDSGYMFLEIELSNDGSIILEGRNCTYWAGYGLQTYKGPIDGLRELYPSVFQELLDLNAIKTR